MQGPLALGLSIGRKMSSVSVTLARGTQTGGPIMAGVATRSYEVQSEGGFFETWISRDYLIARTDYSLAGQQVSPAAGDVISRTVDGIAKTYLVCAPKGMQVFEFRDPEETEIRVHTKEIT